MKKAQHTPDEVKRYNKSFIEFMKAPKEKPTDTKLEMCTIVHKTEVKQK